MNLTQYFDKLEVLFEGNGITNYPQSMPKEKNLLFLYAFYHYFGADVTRFEDLNEGSYFGIAPIGIRLDGLYLNTEYENDEVYLDLICSEFYRNEDEFLLEKKINLTKINLKSIKSVIDGVKKRNFGEFIQLKSRFNQYVDDGNPILKVKLITNITISENNKPRVKKLIADFKSIFKDSAEFEVIFGDEIIQEIEEFDNPSAYVSKGKLSLENSKNILFFGSEKSMITTISAKSLKDLYKSYWRLGLFASNLRYYVKIAKIDNAIQETIINKPEDFWYKNNGIIIVCDDYEINGKDLTLSKFSIVNGGQTTKLIGDTEFLNDFFITAKIIKIDEKNESDKEDFALSIAEATNAQKPIKPRDLIANRPEQRSLKKELLAHDIYLKIKRGDKHNSKIFKDAWQFIDNDELTQILVATIFQDPGLAKNKTRLLTVDSIYSEIYPDDFKYNPEFIKDLLVVRQFKSQYLSSSKLSHNPKNDPFKISILKTTGLLTFSIFGLLLKYYFNSELSKLLDKKILNPSQINYFISQKDLNFGFLNHAEITKEQIFEMFDIVYLHILKPSYEKFRDETSNIDPTVFSKNNSVYVKYVVPIILALLTNKTEFSTKINDLFSQIFVKSNQSKIKNFIESGFNSKYQPNIDEMLETFRTERSERQGVPKGKILSEKVINIITKEKPSSLIDLENLEVLTPYQFNSYGDEIIRIVQEYLEHKGK
jgi:hypothetical protein